jgi:hypothetical protein
MKKVKSKKERTRTCHAAAMALTTKLVVAGSGLMVDMGIVWYADVVWGVFSV